MSLSPPCVTKLRTKKGCVSCACPDIIFIDWCHFYMAMVLTEKKAGIVERNVMSASQHVPHARGLDSNVTGLSCLRWRIVACEGGRIHGGLLVPIH